MTKTVQAILWMIFAAFCPTAKSVKKICGRLEQARQARTDREVKDDLGLP